MTVLVVYPSVAYRFDVSAQYSSMAVLRGWANASSSAHAGTYTKVQGSYGNNYSSITRTISSYNTVVIPSNAVISSAVYSFKLYAPVSNTNNASQHLVSSTLTSFVTGTYSNYGTCQNASFGSIAFSAVSASLYKNITQIGRAHV